MLKEHDPTIRLPAVRTASRLAAVIAAQIAVQTQATQRSFKTIEEDLSEYATDFVSGLIDETTKTFNKRLSKFRARPPQLSLEATIELADDWAGPVAGPTEIERYFGIPRSTLYRWQKRNEVVSINSRTSSKPVFPLKQFVDGRPLSGIAEIISIFGDQRTAWLWLVTRRSDFGGQTGLDLLLDRKVDMVTSAARGSTPFEG